MSLQRMSLARRAQLMGRDGDSFILSLQRSSNPKGTQVNRSYAVTTNDHSRPSAENVGSPSRRLPIALVAQNNSI